MQTGWVTPDKNTFYLGEDGVRTNGWAEIDGKQYYFGSDGVMRRGWDMVDNTWYLFADSGQMLTGDQKLGDRLFHLSDDGKMITGWYETDGGRRWHDSEGAAVSEDCLSARSLRASSAAAAPETTSG